MTATAPTPTPAEIAIFDTLRRALPDRRFAWGGPVIDNTGYTWPMATIDVNEGEARIHAPFGGGYMLCLLDAGGPRRVPSLSALFAVVRAEIGPLQPPAERPRGMDTAKTKLRSLGAPLFADARMAAYGAVLADHMNDKLTPTGVVVAHEMALATLQQRNRPYAANEPGPYRTLVGHEPIFYNLLRWQLPLMATMVFSQEVAGYVVAEFNRLNDAANAFNVETV